MRWAAHQDGPDAANGPVPDAAGHDGGEGQKVDGHVQRQAVVCHPTPRAHPNGADLDATGPNPRHARDAVAFDARHLPQRPYRHFFQTPAKARESR